MPRKYVWILGGLALWVFSGASDWVVNVAFTPWALARPPLLAAWSGRLTTRTGDRLVVVMDLHRGTTGEGTACVRCSQIEGTAVTCDAKGVIRRYDVSGSPRDRQARRLHLGASPETTPAPQGLQLGTLDGAWERPDTLTLQVDFVLPHAWSDDPATQPVPLVMRRVNVADLTEACTQQWR